MPAQERQLGVVLAHHRHRLSARFPLPQQGDQVEGQIGVAAEADLPLGPVRLARSHHLGHHVHALGHQVPDRMGVVGADVVTLLGVIVQIGTGLEEKLRNPDVVWQGTAGHVPGIGEFRDVAIQPLHERRQESALQGGTAAGRPQGQRRHDMELQFRVLPGHARTGH